MQYINSFKFEKSLNNIYKNKKLIFLNPHSVFTLFKDENFFNSININKNNIFFIDGIGLLFILNLKEIFFKNLQKKRITGFDYFTHVINNSYKKTFLFIGTSYENLKKIKQKLLIQNPSCKSIICRTPYREEFKEKDLNIIFKNFNFDQKIDYCFIGTGSPKQEKLSDLIYEKLIKTKKLKANELVNIGAVFNYYTKKMPNVFFIMRFFGFEWLYRILENPRIVYRTLISFPLFLFFCAINLTPKFFKITLLDNVNNIFLKKNFIFSAFNLAFYSFFFSKKINYDPNLYLWPDGVFSTLFNNTKKIPGRELIENLNIPKHINRILVLGNLSFNGKMFLQKKFNIKVVKFDLPFGSASILTKNLPKILRNDLVFITLPTPKQEIIAYKLSKQNKNFKIICIGGGVNMACGDEKPCPKFMEKFEFLWRLRYQTIRRLIRLSITFLLALVSLFTLFNQRLKIINEK